jgi:hypothetical protein
MNQQEEPTRQDIATLARAFYLEREFKAGIFPRTGGDTAHFRKLERLGMLEFTGEWGRDLDLEVDRDVPIYRLTDAGRSWIEKRESASDRCPIDPQPIA